MKRNTVRKRLVWHMVLGAAVGTALSVCITEWVIQPNGPESYARTILSGCIGLILGFTGSELGVWLYRRNCLDQMLDHKKPHDD